MIRIQSIAVHPRPVREGDVVFERVVPRAKPERHPRVALSGHGISRRALAFTLAARASVLGLHVADECFDRGGGVPRARRGLRRRRQPRPYETGILIRRLRQDTYGYICLRRDISFRV